MKPIPNNDSALAKDAVAAIYRSLIVTAVIGIPISGIPA
jgi:hypothetical protein